MEFSELQRPDRDLNVGLCVIATGKYVCFVTDLWESARKFLLKTHSVHLLLFSDESLELPDCRHFPTAHHPWPGPTLYRYHAMLAYQEQLERMDYLFYCDADMRFVGPVGDEILGPLVAVHHPCSYAKPRSGCPYFAKSRSPLESDQFGCPCGRHYYAGAFQGGQSARYLEAMKALRDRIDDDDRRGVVAEWHDETHWNEYLGACRPDIELSPSYCYPEWQQVPFPPRLLALEKSEEELRS